MKDILNCPLDGGVATFVQEDVNVDYGQIVCKRCFIATPFGTFDECRRIWNKRVDFPKQLLEWF